MTELVQTSAPTMKKNWHLPLAPELLLVALGAITYLAFPNDLALATTIVINAIFVMSLGFVLGQAGIASMGHAALYGTGAYAAGIFAMHVSSDPLLGLLTGGLAGAFVALTFGAAILRYKGLTLVMLTLASAQLLYEIANKARRVTGGDDGLSGFDIAPLFGVIEFDFYGKTGYLYAMCVMVLSYYLLRKIIASPFGLTCRAIKSDSGRMEALGCPVYLHLLCAFIIGGFFAGLAGALTAQSTKVVGLNVLDFGASAGALVMLVLGGTNRLAGAVLGTVTYMLIHHLASSANPYHWLFVIGMLLILTMVFLPQGMIQLVDVALRKLRNGGKHV